MRLVTYLVVAAMFTASCDVILNVHLGGTLRFSQFLLLFVCFAALARALQNGRVLWPRGGTVLMLWLFVQFLFLPLSGSPRIGVEFFALLSFTLATVFAIVQLYGDSPTIEHLMRMYMASYVFVGCFGLLQFAMPLVGLPGPLVTQWIVHGRLARINGFSYEPSYFATYMIMGWIMLVELRLSKARIAQGRLWKWALVAITASLVLSTSKTAWVFLALEFTVRLAPGVWRSLRRSLQALTHGRLPVRVPKVSTVIIVAITILAAGIGIRSLVRIVNPIMFLAGTGIANTPAHSYLDRSNEAHATLAAFTASPFLGRTLGGVPIYLAAQKGITITTIEQLRLFWGFPVLLDVLVASGIFGFIPFAVFLWQTTFGALRLARRKWPDERARWLRALGRAMIFEWMLLMVDQNLLRVYLWLHITMIFVVTYHLEFAPAPATEHPNNTISTFPALEPPSIL